jgi:hypothetical protein
MTKMQSPGERDRRGRGGRLCDCVSGRELDGLLIGTVEQWSILRGMSRDARPGAVTSTNTHCLAQHKLLSLHPFSSPPLSATPFFSLNSHSTTIKFSLQYLVPYVTTFHAFFLIEIVTCSEMKNSTFLTPDLV